MRPAKKVKTCGHSSSTALSAAAPPTFLEDLIEPVLRRLSISQIDGLKRDSNLWASMLQTPSLKQACAAAHPKLFGVVGWNRDREAMWTTAFDLRTFEWNFIELTDFPKEEEYFDAMFASDGGLVCFVPRIGKKLAALAIVVYNPLTNESKLIPKGEGSPFGKRQLILVQMVMDEDNKCYRVILVYGDNLGAACGAVVYNSRGGIWTDMNAGLVFGAANTLWHAQQDPHIFDCTHKVLHNLNYIGSDLAGPRSYSFVQDKLFMLDNSARGKFKLYEYVWKIQEVRSVIELQTRQDSLSDSTQEYYYSVLLPCSKFIMLGWDNDDSGAPDQRYRLYDIAAKKMCCDISADSSDVLGTLQRSAVCDLRWDATP